MALLVGAVPHVHREVQLRNKPASMLAASPKGTVPVLVLGGGTVLEESLDIMRWALSQSDPENWLVRSDEAWISAFEPAFKEHLDRYKYADRYDGDPHIHRAAGLSMLNELDERLFDAGFLGGRARGFDDIAIFPFVRQYAGVAPEWFASTAPQRVRRWLEALVGSSLFERAMVKLPPWKDGMSGQ